MSDRAGGVNVWRGAAGDEVEAARQVGQDVPVPEPEDAETLHDKPCIPPEVAQAAVAGAVGLDDRAMVCAMEIDNEGADRNLTAQLQALKRRSRRAYQRARSAGVIPLRIRRARGLDKSVC